MRTEPGQPVSRQQVRWCGTGPVMRLILLGPPGSGKGTQAKLLSQHNAAWSTSAPGTFFAKPCASRPPLGLRAKPFVDSGQLVPDDLVNDVVAERFHRDDRPEPSSWTAIRAPLAQAAAFDQVLRQQFLDLTAVCSADGRRRRNRPPHERAAGVARRAARRPTTSVNNPPKKPGICDYLWGETDPARRRPRRDGACSDSVFIIETPIGTGRPLSERRACCTRSPAAARLRRSTVTS